MIKLTKTIRFIIGLTPLFFAVSSFAGTTFPKPQGFVNDFAKVMNDEKRIQLETTLTSFERESGIEIAVVTLPSLEGRPVEDVAVDLFAQWGVGKKGKDNGLLFLIAPNDRRMHVEVGYGLEGVMNDALAGRILDQVVVPRFKAGDVDGGIAAGTLALVEVIAQKEPISQERRLQPHIPWPLKLLSLLIFISLLIRYPWLIFFIGGGSGSFGRGGFSGGFGGFGGGMSGGGGSSRSW